MQQMLLASTKLPLPSRMAYGYVRHTEQLSFDREPVLAVEALEAYVRSGDYVNLMYDEGRIEDAIKDVEMHGLPLTRQLQRHSSNNSRNKMN